MDENRVIIDIVENIRREATAEMLEELSGMRSPQGAPEFVDWHARIDEMNLSAGGCAHLTGEVIAQLRDVLHRVVDMTCRVGGRVVPVGKRVIKWVLTMIQRYPETVVALVVLAALAFIVGSVPIVGGLLSSIVMTVGAFVAGYVFIHECIGGTPRFSAAM